MKTITLFTMIIWGSMATYGQVITNYTSADGLISDNVNCVDVDASGTIWFGTQLGISTFDGASTWFNYPTTQLPDDNITAIYCADNGDVWVGTDFGCSVLSGGSWTTYTTTDGLGNNQIKCIVEDQNGMIWFGTNNGASQFTGSAWNNYGTAEGLPFGGITAITPHTDGTLWMGSGLGGVQIFNGSTFSAITSADGLIDDRIRGIGISAQTNQRWVGTSEGITVLNETNSFVEHHTRMFTLPAPDTLNPVEDVEIDGNGIIWVGVYVDYLVTEGGVCAFNGTNWVEYHVSDGLVGPVVRALAIDANNDVWVATSTGISKIHDPSVGIKDEQQEEFILFPNPTTDYLTITSSNLGDQIPVVMDAQGRALNLGFQVMKNVCKIDVRGLDRGVYYVQLSAGIKSFIVD